MFDIKRFGAYISRLRKKADMTQSELAERLNLTRQAISKYECGDSFPDISILIEIADVFGITLDELISSGHPTLKEAAILECAVEGQDIYDDLDKQCISDIVNIAPLLKPSLLDKMAKGLAKHGIDISSIVSLAEYINDDTVIKLLENATYDTINETLLERLIPFLDGNSISIIFQKILEGELDYKLIRIMLPHAEYIYPQVEAAVLFGGLDEKALTILRDYESENDGLRHYDKGKER
ncbi:helix-turn-helix domain-containing protein [Anaerocolumna sp. MB42-C2]|uniref:helix-turn-helix domain-containing protein n=1 Tax=Anaerocolumna sp. MB42-C2 TaxID=3070997 RepID=UPI0027E0EB1A|nr:helix-turn-helix transcriptional regulator [Anaerocolumna sp. MB42-C2]WMJ86972.1 helix-turn-helix transcriptional regulator [Anaerocolumna sp. MB42-C2]